MLLTALFTSSCYWQPVPTRNLFETLVPSALPESPGTSLLYLPNATFTDEKNAEFSRAIPIPRLTTMVDRCWCELGRFFTPYNGTEWQMTSLLRNLGFEQNNRAIVLQHDHIESTTKLWLFKSEAAFEEDKAQEEIPEEEVPHTSDWNFFSSPFVASLRSFFPLSKNTTTPPASPPESDPVLEPVALEVEVEAVEEDTRKGWIRPTYDLRAMGVNAILDLSWGRSTDTV